MLAEDHLSQQTIELLLKKQIALKYLHSNFDCSCGSYGAFIFLENIDSSKAKEL